MWFMIKTQHSWTQGPHHVLLQLRYVREMSPSVQALIGKYLKSSACNAHSEAILLSGTESVGTILHNTDTRPRFRHNPVTLNLNANSIQDMIEWDKEVLHEPYLTCSMTEEELQAAVLNGLRVPYFPVHGQASERTVKLVTEVASAVAGWDKRDGYIRVRRTNRNDMPQLNKKSDFFSSEDSFQAHVFSDLTNILYLHKWHTKNKYLFYC